MTGFEPRIFGVGGDRSTTGPQPLYSGQFTIHYYSINVTYKVLGIIWRSLQSQAKNYIQHFLSTCHIEETKIKKKRPIKRDLFKHWFFLKMGHSRPPYLYFRLFNTVYSKQCSIKILPTTEFEPQTSGVGSACSTN